MIPADRSDAKGVSALPTWAEAALVGDYVRMAVLGRPASQSSIAGERSGVDIQLVLAYRNSGRTRGQFVADRSPDGLYPSPTAFEKGSEAHAYLEKQWDFADVLPQPYESISVGLDRLDEFEALIEAWPHFTHPRRTKPVLLAFCQKTRELGKTTLGLDQRSLSELCGLTHATVSAALKDTSSKGVGRFLESVSPDDVDSGTEQDDKPQIERGNRYRLRILEILDGAFADHSDRANRKTGNEWSGIAPFRNHPAFINVKGAFGSTGYETWRCYGEPRTQAEACRISDGVGERTFKKRTKQLRCAGALIYEPGGKKLMQNKSFDLDCFAELHGLNAVLDRRARRSDQERLERLDVLVQKDELDQETADLRKTQLKAKEVRRIEVANERRLVRPRTDDGRLIDLITGEVEAPDSYDTAGQSAWSDERTEAAHAASADFVVPAIVQFGLGATGGFVGAQPIVDVELRHAMNCVCCGSPTQRIEPSIGLPWGEGCLMQPWLVRHHEKKLGLTIPSELRSHTSHSPVSLDDEWATYGKELVAA